MKEDLVLCPKATQFAIILKKIFSSGLVQLLSSFSSFIHLPLIIIMMMMMVCILYIVKCVPFVGLYTEIVFIWRKERRRKKTFTLMELSCVFTVRNALQCYTTHKTIFLKYHRTWASNKAKQNKTKNWKTRISFTFVTYTWTYIIYGSMKNCSVVHQNALTVFFGIRGIVYDV